MKTPVPANRIAGLTGKLSAVSQVLSAPWRVISTLNPASIAEFVPPEGQQHANREKHPNCVELNLAISGEAVFGIGNKYVRLTPGNCLLQTMVDEHDTGCSLSEEFIYCCLHFYAGYVFYEFFQLNGTKYCSLGSGKLECPLRFCIRDELENIRTMPLPQEGKLHYLNLLLELLRLQLSIVEIQPKQFTHPQYRILAAARKIEASRGRECNADIMARESGYSKFHFLRLFREETGKSFREYVNHVRCTAYRELVNQGFSKKNIADELGFSSAAALSHWSRRQKTLGTI